MYLLNVVYYYILNLLYGNIGDVNYFVMDEQVPQLIIF